MRQVVERTRRGMRVGELARKSGLSVRALHYYDEIGLLPPSHHTESGHRLYGSHDVVRLQQIVSLRQLGLSLDDIKEMLDRPGMSPLEVMELHIARLRNQIALQSDLCKRLSGLASSLRWEQATGHRDTVSVEDFLEAIEEMKKVETEFTPEQMEKIKEQGRILGDQHIREVEAEWPGLIEQVRDLMDAGVDPADEQVQKLAKRWMELVSEFTGGDPGIERTLANKYRQDPTAGGRLDPRMLEYMSYIGKAMSASGSAEE